MHSGKGFYWLSAAEKELLPQAIHILVILR